MTEIEENKKYCLQATYCNSNFGSVLQCFATQAFLKKHNIDCYLVEKQDKGITRLILSIKRRIIIFFKMIRFPEIRRVMKEQSNSSAKSIKSISSLSKNMIDEFVNANIRTVQVTSNDLRTLSENDNCIYYLTGSDQIWNSRRIIPDKVYFATYAPRGKRIAFAASFGSMRLPRYNSNYLKKYISKYNRISIREKSGIDLVKTLTGREATHLLDPVFLLSQEEWREFARISNEKICDKYILCFFLDDPLPFAVNDIIKLANSGNKIISIGYKHNEISEFVEYYDCDPRSFVNFINQAKCLLTDSFHATAFATILHKPFYTYKRNYYDNDQSIRLEDFLKEMHLSEMYVQEDNRREDASLLDFSHCDRRIAENTIRAIQFLGL